MRQRAVLASAFVLFVTCAGCTTAGHEAIPRPASCPMVDASACQSPIPSYTNGVSPLLDRNCNRTCHAPGVGPWPLTDYQSVVAWSDLLVQDIENCTMPPPDAGTLTTDERKMLLDWIACNTPNN